MSTIVPRSEPPVSGSGPTTCREHDGIHVRMIRWDFWRCLTCGREFPAGLPEKPVGGTS